MTAAHTQETFSPSPPPPPGDAPRGRFRFMPWLMIVIGTAAFVAVALDVHFHGRLERLDQPIAAFIHQRNTPRGVLLFSAISYLGDLKVILLVAVIVLFWLWKTGRKRAMVVWLGALVGSAVINQGLKAIFQVPRPERFTFYVFPPHPGYSFPSGHTMGVGITAGATALLLMHVYRAPARTRYLAGAAVGALTVLVAFALLYMGVHYLTDVLGGLAVVLGWLGVVSLFLPPRTE